MKIFAVVLLVLWSLGAVFFAGRYSVRMFCDQLLLALPPPPLEAKAPHE
jgi:nitrate reductase NapE component